MEAIGRFNLEGPPRLEDGGGDLISGSHQYETVRRRAQFTS